MTRLRLTTGVRLVYDDVRCEQLLLVPEGIVRLNSSAAEVLALCDGTRSLDEIIDALAAHYDASDLRNDVRSLINAMTERGIVIDAAA